MKKQDNSQPSSQLRFCELEEDKDYLIYEDGSVYSKKCNRFLTGKIDNVGYRVYALAIGDARNVSGKKLSKMVYAHRLVAKYFIPNPNNLPYVNHKDENKLNNNVNNLEWVTEQKNTQLYLQNRQQAVRKTPRYLEKNLDGEIWKIILNCSRYSVSNFGRVKNNKTNRLLHQDSTQVYNRVTLINDVNKKQHFYVHRLVYCTFYNDYNLDNYIVDHIDANPKNNKLSNLQKITQSENCCRQKRFN